jgi:type VI protein secretion system component Hcp
MSVNFRRACAAIVLLACTAAASPHDGTATALLDVPTIKGTVITKGYTGWIQVQSYGFGVGLDVLSGGGRSGKASAVPLHLQKTVDETSPLFAQAYFSGKPFAGTTKLDILESNKGELLPAVQVELHDATVLSDSTATGSDSPTEQISIAYDAIQYCIPSSNGTQLCTAWNFKTNTSSYPSN